MSGLLSPDRRKGIWFKTLLVSAVPIFCYAKFFPCKPREKSALEPSACPGCLGHRAAPAMTASSQRPWLPSRPARPAHGKKLILRKDCIIFCSGYGRMEFSSFMLIYCLISWVLSRSVGSRNTTSVAVQGPPTHKYMSPPPASPPARPPAPGCLLRLRSAAPVTEYVSLFPCIAVQARAP